MPVKDVKRENLPDLQNEKDVRGKHIERAGVARVQIPLKVSRKDAADGIPEYVQANVWMYASIGEEHKGANMCYDAQTEVLSENGWKLFKDLVKDEKVATLNLATNSFEWQVPLKYFEGDYSGKMFSLESRGVNLCITPNHTLVVQNSSGIKTIQAKDFFGRTGFRMLKTANWEGDSPKTIDLSSENTTYKSRGQYRFPAKDFMKLLGYFLAEGCTHTRPTEKKGHYQVIWSIGEENILNELKDILAKQNISAWACANGDSGVFNLLVSNKCLYEYFAKLGKSTVRYIPQDIKNLSPELLHTLFEYYMKGDGSHTKTSRSFYTSSKQLADDFQEVGVKCGFGVHIKQAVKGVNAFKPGGIYYVGYISTNIAPIINPGGSTTKAQNKWVSYKGKIHCCEVPNGTLLVRRKGIPIWSGNSRFLETLMEYENVQLTSKSLKQIIEDMLQRLGSGSTDGYMKISFRYFLPKYAPVSKKRGVQGYDVSFIGRLKDNTYDWGIEVAATGTNCCPCSKEISSPKIGGRGGAHNQRNHVKVRFTPNDSLFWIEDVIALIEGQFSCPIYPLLKREDEKWVTEMAYENPKFVEDLARDVAVELDKRNIERYKISSTADESIHHHEAEAFISKDWILG